MLTIVHTHEIVNHGLHVLSNAQHNSKGLYGGIFDSKIVTCESLSDAATGYIYSNL